MSRSASVQINLYGRRHDRDVLKRVAAQRGTSVSALVMNWVRSLESPIQPNAEPPASGEIRLASPHDRDHNREENDP